jgi:drug/metabolite transporter (DMT)-like permease
MKHMRNQNAGYMFGLAAVFLWSTVAAAFKLTLRYVDPVQLVFYSCFFSTLVLGIILVSRQKLSLVFSCSRREYLRSFLLGTLNPFIYYLVLFKAYDLLPAQEAQPLNYTWGLVLPLLSVPLLKQKIGARDLVALLLGYVGVFVISTHGDVLGFRLTNPLGVGLALGSAVLWAFYWIFNTRDRRDPVVCLFLCFLFALPLAFMACLAFSDPILDDVRGLLGTAYVGLFEMSITFVLWLMALRLSENMARISILIFVSPFFSLIFIHFLVGEKILPSTIAGLVFIVAGIILQKTGRDRAATSSREFKHHSDS